MHQILSWWDSHESLSTVGTVLKFTGAIIGILILILGLRESFLRSKAQADEKAKVVERISLAEAAARPRRLAPTQREGLIASLTNLSNKPEVFIAAGVLDSESMDFAEDIEGALTASGFPVHFPKGLSGDASLSVGPSGIHLVVKDPTATHPVAAQIQKCFMDSGLSIPGLRSSDADFPADRIQIAVGQK